MKNRLLVTCTFNLCITTLTFAGPGGGGMHGGGFGGDTSHGSDRMMGGRHIGSDYRQNDDLFEDLQERRRAREERGFQRLKQLKWKIGYTIPQHYRSDRYKVNALAFHLPAAENSQQWYKINSDFVLVDANNTIIDVR